MMNHHQTTANYQSLFIGVDTQVPLLDGSLQRYINLDNAASTPPLKAVQSAIDSFLPFYSSVHRGMGFKSQLSTYAYEVARDAVMEFVHANPNDHVCIFGKNTTEAINKLAHRFPFSQKRNVVLLSSMEHHSNDLPWRKVAKTIHVALTPEGRLNEADFDVQLERYADQIALVAITGASNVTGFINPIHKLAEKVHAVGAHILADCAQLAPHREVHMLPLENPLHLDYVAISAHKMYAPFGTGALVARRDVLSEGVPDHPGGGTVEIVTLEDVVWADPPARDEAGSPHTVGAVALMAAIQQLESIGMNRIAQHEAELTAYALERLTKISGIRIYGDNLPNNASERLGVIPFEVLGISHFKVSAILSYEFGIGVRSGCFCAHPYILHLLNLSSEEAQSVRRQIISGDKSDMPGLTRASFGLYNSFDEIDALAYALERVTAGKYAGKYHQVKTSGEFFPDGWNPAFEDYLPF